MSELFNEISNFYGGDSMLKASFADLCFVAADISRSLVTGEAIEVTSSDSCMNRRKRIEQTSRLDTIVCLGRISALLETKLKDLPQSEVQSLDRMHELMSKAELPKRLDNHKI